MGVLAALLTAYGCASLRDVLSDAGTLPDFFKALFRVDVSYAQVVPIAVFIAVMALTLWFLNWPRFADFLIDTELEMGKVAWPARKAVVASSVVVIVTMVVMGVMLYGIDVALLFVLRRLIKLY
jgi:preprotein translocase SecE subunit